jgi:hypothetical protein
MTNDTAPTNLEKVDLDIPDAAVDAYRDVWWGGWVGTPPEEFNEVVDSMFDRAAPLIVAAELRRLAKTVDQDCAAALTARAQQLDPEQLT